VAFIKRLFPVVICLLIISGCQQKEGQIKVGDPAVPAYSDQNEESWTASPEFNTSTGTSLIGEKDKIGLLSPGFVAGQGNKYMWHFWGDEKTLTSGDFKVVAVNQEGEKTKALVQNAGTAAEKKVWNYGTSSVAPNNGADTHTPSNLSLPSPGLWRLNVYFGDRLFGSIVVEVK
jgi:hypothetical protein